jgi:hypothetical protein
MTKTPPQLELTIDILTLINKILGTNDPHNFISKNTNQDLKLKMLHLPKMSNLFSLKRTVSYNFESDVTLILKLLNFINFKDSSTQKQLNRTIKNILKFTIFDITNHIYRLNKNDSFYISHKDYSFEQSYFCTLLIQHSYQIYSLKKIKKKSNVEKNF